MSWPHFVVGLRSMAREADRDVLTFARGSRLGQATEADYRAHVREIERML
jgi:hypothetical protein